MKRFLSGLAALYALAFCLAVSLPAFARADEVDTNEVLRYGDSAELVGAGIADPGADLFKEAMQVPKDDNHKWFISVYCKDDCPPCAKLLADVQTSPSLMALINAADHKASWSHFNVYHKGDRSQAFRFTKLKIATYPTIVVNPPLNKRYGDPQTVVAQINGYSSDKELAQQITAAIRRYCDRIAPRQKLAIDGGFQEVVLGQTAAGADTRVSPWQPRPQQETPTPPSDPFLPMFPPLVAPTIPPLDIAPPAPAIPKAPQIIVITDGSEAEQDLGPIKALVARLKANRASKVRELDFDEAVKQFPVDEEDLPAVFVTADGKIESKILGRLLPSLTPPTPAAPPAKEVTVEVPVKAPFEFGDIPWDAFLAILAGGFTPAALIPIGIWVFKLIRNRRKATGAPVLADDQFANLVEKFAPVIVTIVQQAIAGLGKKKEETTQTPAK